MARQVKYLPHIGKTFARLLHSFPCHIERGGHFIQEDDPTGFAAVILDTLAAEPADLA